MAAGRPIFVSPAELDDRACGGRVGCAERRPGKRVAQKKERRPCGVHHVRGAFVCTRCSRVRVPRARRRRRRPWRRADTWSRESARARADACVCVCACACARAEAREETSASVGSVYVWKRFRNIRERVETVETHGSARGNAWQAWGSAGNRQILRIKENSFFLILRFRRFQRFPTPATRFHARFHALPRVSTRCHSFHVFCGVSNDLGHLRRCPRRSRGCRSGSSRGVCAVFRPGEARSAAGRVRHEESVRSARATQRLPLLRTPRPGPGRAAERR